MMLLGSDISAYQGNVPPAGKFCIIKVTEGLTYVSSKWERQAGYAKSMGQLRGFYHFPHYSNNPIAEADFFCDTVAKVLGHGDIVVLDHESSSPPPASKVAAWGVAFCKRVTQRLSRMPVVYSNLYFAENGFCAGLGGYPWWAAYYNNAPGHVTPKGPFKIVVLHQYTDKPYDKDAFLGDENAWLSLGSGGKDSEVSSLASLGADGSQIIEAGQTRPVLFSHAYSDKTNLWHEGKDGKGYSLFPTASAWCLTSAIFRLTGLNAGDKVVVAFQRDKSDGKGGWVTGDEAWFKTYTAGTDNEIADDLHGSFGVGKDLRLRLQISNRAAVPITVHSCMWKAVLLSY